MPSDIDAPELYVVVRKAVEDAVWSVLGSLFTLTLTFALFLVGLQIAIAGTGLVTTPASYVVPLAGVVLMTLAVLLALRELRLWPFQYR